MIRTSHNVEIVTELTARLLALEVATRRLGFAMLCPTELCFMWHYISWDRDDGELFAAISVMPENLDEHESPVGVQMALATIPVVSHVRMDADDLGRLEYSFLIDVSDLDAISQWLRDRCDDQACAYCGRSE